MARLRVGLVGMGVMGTHHARVLAALEGVEFIGVADPGVTDSASRNFWVTSRLEELLSKGVDYAVVATPTSNHLDVALQLADAGIPSLIEKPLAGSSASARQITSAFQDRGILASAGHIERFNPAASEAHRRIQDGQLGRVLQISTRRVGPYPVRITDASVVHDFGIHDIDLAHWLGGAPYSWVAAAGLARGTSARTDCLSVTATSEAGTVINHVVNWISPYRDRTIVITGDRGVLEIDTISATLTFKSGAPQDPVLEEAPYFHTLQVGDVVTYAMDRVEPLLLQHRAFRDAVLGLGGRVVPLAEAAHAVAVADAALASSVDGTSVRVETIRP